MSATGVLQIVDALREAAEQAEADAAKLHYSVHGQRLAEKAKRWRGLLADVGSAAPAGDGPKYSRGADGTVLADFTNDPGYGSATPAGDVRNVAAKLVNRIDSDGGKTTTFIRPTALGMDLPLGEYPLYLDQPATPAGGGGELPELPEPHVLHDERDPGEKPLTYYTADQMRERDRMWQARLASTGSALDEAAILRAVRAHDREDAAQKGEPDPWADDFPEPYYSERMTSMRLALEAAGASTGSAQSEPQNVECRECNDCGHVGINDAHAPDAACHSCDWSGPSPVEDKCPGCGDTNCMGAACPDCSSLYRLIASTELPGTGSAPAPSADTKRLDAIADNYWKLDPFDMPTPGGDDADVGWKVIQYHRGQPREREVAVVYRDDPREAIDAAMSAAPTQEAGYE